MTESKVVILNLEPRGFSQQAKEGWQAQGDYHEAEFDTRECQTVAGLATVLIVRLARKITAEILDGFPKLEVLISATTGHDHIDQEALAARNIRLVSLRGDDDFLATIPSTAEHAFALMLALLRKIPLAQQSVLEGRWQRDNFIGRQLSGCRLGIVGLGRTGKMLAGYATAFGMQVSYFDPSVSDERSYQRCESLSALVEGCEILSLHVHLSDDTEGMINQSILASANQGLYLINTSRGQILDEHAVVSALQSGQLAGVAVDVLASELDDIKQSPLHAAARRGENVIITPHIAGATVDAMQTCEERMVQLYQQI